MFYIHRWRSNRHGTSVARPKRRFASFGFALLIIASTITSVPLFTSTNSYAAITSASKGSKDFSWQTKSFLYYRALAHCFKYSAMAGGGSGLNTNFLDDSQASSGQWFHGGGPGVGHWQPIAPAIGVYMRDATSGDSMDVGTDGKVNCNNTNFIKAALSHWGVNATEVLCESGYRRSSMPPSQTVAECKAATSGNFERREGGLDNNASKFAAFIRNVIYGGNEPSLTGPQWYIYYRHSLSQSCISGLDSKPPGTTPTGNDNPYGYNNVKWVDISADPPAVLTGSYVGTWAKSTNVALRVGEASSFNNFERSCAEAVSLMNNYADAYRDWADANPTDAAAVESDVLAGNDAAGNGPTSCVIEGTGWIICSLAKTLAQFMDGVYGLLASFMAVQPLNVDTSSNANFVYRVWSIMQGIANVLFVIAFLIIIFSQLTSVGISNYGVKKLLPRLVVSAVLVNTSFWISAILVDISNIAGAGIYNLIQSITEGNLGDITVSTNLWEDVIVILLSAGALGGAATALNSIVVAGAAAAGGAASAALWSMLPVLLAGVLAVIVAFAVLAARQALIIILIILSPLAFVAYLLPNTENLFKLWKSSFTTMLVFYPMFAIIFAGSQLAGFIIIGSIPETLAVKAPMVILGLFVMVAPLILTPLLVKFSGGLIGQLAGKINNSNKGLIDRSKKVAERKRGLAMGEVMGSQNASKNPFVRGMRGAYRRLQNSGRLDAERKNAIDAQNQAAYDKTLQPILDKNGNPVLNDDGTPALSRSQQAYNAINNAKATSQIAQNDAEATRLEQDGVVELAKELHASKLTVDVLEGEHELAAEMAADRNKVYEKTRLENAVEGVKMSDKVRYQESLSQSTPVNPNDPMAESISAARMTEQQSNIKRDRLASADTVLQQQYAKTLTDRPDMAEDAGGIDPRGKSRVVARATQVVEEARRKAVAAEVERLSTLRADPKKLATQVSQTHNPDGTEVSQDQIEATIQYIAKTGTAADIMQMTDQLASPEFATQNDPSKGIDLSSEVLERNRQIQQTFGAAVGASGKVASISGGSYGKLSIGEQITTYKQQMLNTIKDKKFKGESLAKMDIDEIGELSKIVETPEFEALPAESKLSLQKAIQKRLTDPLLANGLNDRDKDAYTAIQRKINIPIPQEPAGPGRGPNGMPLPGDRDENGELFIKH